MEQPDRVGSAAHAGNRHIRQAAGKLQHLRPGLAADHRLQLAHQIRIGMRSHGRAQNIIGAVGVGNPVAQRLVDGGAQGLIPGGHRYHGGTHELHAAHVGSLALDVDSTHVHEAGQSQTRRGGGARHTVLSGAGFRDDALGAKAFRKQRLPQRVVDLVSAGMREVLALQPYFGSPALAQRRCERQRRGTADPGLQFMVELGLKVRAVQVAVDACLQAIERGNQCFGNITAAECAVAAFDIGVGGEPRGAPGCPALEAPNSWLLLQLCGRRARRAHELMNLVRILDARHLFHAAAHVDSERPHRLHGFATFSAERPPARITSVCRASSAARPQSATSPMPLEGPSNTMRGGSGFGVLRPKRTTGSTLMCERNLQFTQILDIGLKIIRLENAADLVHLHLQRMLGDRDSQDSGRRERRELRRLSGRHLPRARGEHEADSIHIGRGGGADCIGTGYAANLDPHRYECSHLRRYCPCLVEDFREQSGRILTAHQAPCRSAPAGSPTGACGARRRPWPLRSRQPRASRRGNRDANCANRSGTTCKVCRSRQLTPIEHDDFP